MKKGIVIGCWCHTTRYQVDVGDAKDWDMALRNAGKLGMISSGNLGLENLL